MAKKKRKAVVVVKKFDLETQSDEALRSEQVDAINSVYQMLHDANVGEATQKAFSVVLLEYRKTLTSEYNEEMSASQEIAITRLRVQLGKDIMTNATAIVRAHSDMKYQHRRWAETLERLVRRIEDKLPKGTVGAPALASRDLEKIEKALVKASV